MKITAISTETKYLMGVTDNPLRFEGKEYAIRFNEFGNIEYFDELGEWNEPFHPMVDFIFYVDGVQIDYFSLIQNLKSS